MSVRLVYQSQLVTCTFGLSVYFPVNMPACSKVQPRNTEKIITVQIFVSSSLFRKERWSPQQRATWPLPRWKSLYGCGSHYGQNPWSTTPFEPHRKVVQPCLPWSVCDACTVPNSITLSIFYWCDPVCPLMKSGIEERPWIVQLQLQKMGLRQSMPNPGQKHRLF